MQASSATATGTSKTGDYSKGTGEEETSLAGLKDEKVNRTGGQRQPDEGDSQWPIYQLSHKTAKLPWLFVQGKLRRLIQKWKCRDEPGISSDDQKLKLEPTLLALDVGPDKLFVRLCQVDNSLDEADDGTDAARHQGDNDLDDSFRGVSKNKLVHTETAEQDPANTRNDLFIGALLFPILH